MVSPPLPLALFDYDLPEDCIAQEPARPRDSSKLLRLSRSSGAVTHHVFRDLPALLRPTDVLVVNRTKVIPARLFVKRETGGRVELLFLHPLDAGLQEAKRWRIMGRPGDALKPGKTLVAADGMRIEVVEKDGAEATVIADKPLWRLLQSVGEMPLPPYISRKEGAKAADASDYQTIFARDLGAVAAPTASLHFTEQVLQDLATKGIARVEVVLHVGAGTFLPVRDEHEADVRKHVMHAETYEIPAATLSAIKDAKAAGRRIVAVGTTAARALETWAESGEPRGQSQLFIYPGYTFALVDVLLTNLHLPRSTLLMLVAALAGRERVLDAYATAIANGYRFFSYGDAMLIDQ